MDNIIKQLKEHLPFTIIGSILGVILMFFLYNIPKNLSYNIFYILHPLHVLLSALVTSSIYILYSKKDFKIWKLILVGYIGSVGIATLSDSVIPYLGEILLNLPNKGIHLGFIEKYWLVNPLAFLGILIAYFKPKTKLPHAGHVLLSVFASLFHIIMAMAGVITISLMILSMIFIFIAVIIPCCLSDIIFPLLFVKSKLKSLKSNSQKSN